MCIHLTQSREDGFDLFVNLLSFQLISLDIPISFLNFFRIIIPLALYWKNSIILFIFTLIYDLYIRVFFCNYLKSLQF